MKAGKDTPVCFIDIKKAFPSVRRSSMLHELSNKGISGPVWHIIHTMYQHNQSYIIVGHVKSSGYEVRNGVREGAILSPLLYILFLNMLLQQLRAVPGSGLQYDAVWFLGHWHLQTTLSSSASQGT